MGRRAYDRATRGEVPLRYAPESLALALRNPESSEPHSMNPSTFASRGLAAVAVLAALASNAGAQTIGCVTGGSGALIPSTGTGGGGTYQTVLPPSPAVATLNVNAIPPGATVVTEVKLLGLSHTYVYDLQFVLTSPSGAVHNLWTRPNSGGSVVFSCDFGGDYTLVPPSSCAQSYPGSCTSPSIFPVGVWAQDFGDWISGNSGIFNTPLDTIPAQTGVWTLTIYDWAGADVGSLTTWELCFGTAGGAAPTSAPTAISPSASASVTAPVTFTWSALNCATSYDLDVDGVVNTGVNSTSATVALGNGAHTWRVRAVNGAGVGPWSGTVGFTVIAAPTCVGGTGPSGLIPATGSGGNGAWPTTLPPFEFVSTQNIPSPGASLAKVEINGLSHTWVGDIQIVLTDPTGANHNIMCRPNSIAGGLGLDCDMDGTTYSFWQSGQQDLPTVCPGTSFTGGEYNQYFGDWNSGDAGIFNTPLGLIPVSAGNWTLKVYDWAAGDSGAITSWRLCFAGPSGPTTFCPPSGQGTTNGCVASISATGNPNVAQTAPCVITVSSVEGQKTGLLFYGISGQVNFPWCASGGNSFLCVKGPTQRIFPQATGGTAGQCNGQLVNDWYVFQQSFPGALGQPFAAGDVISMQGWFRDPPNCKTTFISQGLTLTYQP